MPPLVLVGFDAESRTLATDLASEGRLPALRSVMESGRSTPVESPHALFVGAVWPTFSTGVNTGRHGRYCFGQLRPGTYRVHRTGDPLPYEPFWRPLSRAGRRLAIIDVPHTRPDPDISGINVVDWGKHDPNVGFTTTPRDLGDEILHRFGDQPTESCDDYARRGAHGQLRDDLVDGIARKTELCEAYLTESEWDVFAVVFNASHCAGHQGWHLHDASHPRYDAAKARAIGDPVTDIYEAHDAALGRILGAVGPDATVMVLLSHGMGLPYNANFLLSDMLAPIADAQYRKAPLSAARERSRRAIGRYTRKHGVRAPGAFMWYVDGARPFFAIPNNNVYGGIRVNLRGREPHGLVSPGREYEDVCGMLENELLTWKNLETGEPLVQNVTALDDYYSGPERASMPDLVVEWNHSAPIRSIGAPRYGRVDRESISNRTGDHIPGGLLVTRGPGIEPGSTGEEVSMLDLAPTICAAVDVDLPGVDGTVRPDLIGAA